MLLYLPDHLRTSFRIGNIKYSDNRFFIGLQSGGFTEGSDMYVKHHLPFLILIRFSDITSIIIHLALVIMSLHERHFAYMQYLGTGFAT